MTQISNTKITSFVWTYACATGKDGLCNLFFTAYKIGIHSNKFTVSLAMHLVNVPIFTIRLIGRQKQTKAFALGVTNKISLTRYFTQSLTKK